MAETILTQVVGFEDEAEKIIRQLVGRSKQVDIISIVGMPGIGKTTLALKVYNDPYVAYHFYIRAWISVSQVYQKRDLLLGILSSPHIPHVNGIRDMSEEKLSETLYKRLKGNRYLIVLDDIWNKEVWDDLKIYFPKDNNGSRVMFTSRDRGVALYAKVVSVPHDLRFLSGDESWVLLQEKVFNKENCPQELMEVGRRIAEKCRGLPLAIVVVGGLLAKTEKTKQWWTQVGESMTSHIDSDSKTLELSYNHLPNHLKPLFLYFGAFPEDHEILISKLIWLWMAEGFIVRHGDETLEDAAEGYLMDLIERSLIIIANRGCNGRVKSCRIHDLLRDFCLRKACEEKFMLILFRNEHFSLINSSSFSSSSPDGNQLYRLSTNFTFFEAIPFQHLQNICSLLLVTPASFDYQPDFQHFKLLRVLDFSHGISQHLPSEIEQLVHLRYLVLYMSGFGLSRSVYKLKNLETLVFRGIGAGSLIGTDIFKLTKLRHLHIEPLAHFPLADSRQLAGVQTMSTPVFLSERKWLILTSTPNLRKLKCICSDLRVPSMPRGLEFLVKLETLNMRYLDIATSNIPQIFQLPVSLKKITLSLFCFDWSEISKKLAGLPNLEVLKLENRASKGELWNSFVESYFFKPFPKLKFLKFDSLDIVQWIASRDHFPSLQRLVLNKCERLESIPSDLGNILTLELIELNWSSHSAANSAWEILKEQRDIGNEQLKIFIYPPSASSFEVD